MLRLLFDLGPWDGGTAEIEAAAPKSRKRKAVEPPVLPPTVFAPCGSRPGFVWLYTLTRELSPYSARYTLCGWVSLHEVPRTALILSASP